MLDGILLHSQQRMLEAIAQLHDSVHQSASRGEGEANVAAHAVPQDLAARIARIEATQASLAKSLKGLHTAVRTLTVSAFERGSWEIDVLLHIEQQFYDDGEADMAAAAAAGETDQDTEDEDQGGADSGAAGYGSLPWWLCGLIVPAAAGVAYRRYKGRRKGNDKIM